MLQSSDRICQSCSFSGSHLCFISMVSRAAKAYNVPPRSSPAEYSQLTSQQNSKSSTNTVAPVTFIQPRYSKRKIWLGTSAKSVISEAENVGKLYAGFLGLEIMQEVTS